MTRDTLNLILDVMSLGIIIAMGLFVWIIV